MSSEASESLATVLKSLEAVFYAEASTNSHVKATPSSNGRVSSINGQDIADDGLGPEGESMLPLLVAVALISRNEPEDYAALFTYFATESKHQNKSPESLAKLVLRLRTALFKCVPLYGVPRVINASASLQQAVLAHPGGWKILHNIPMVSTKQAKTTTEQDAVVGWRFFKAIYERHAETIFTRINGMNPELAEMIVDDLYGANMARTEVLSWKETVLVEFVGCASMDCPAQAKGHFYGAKNIGVLKQDVKNAVEVVKQIGAWRGEPLDEQRMPFLKVLDSWPAYWPWLGPPNRQHRGSPAPAPR